MELEGRKALVTGAGSGIGRAIAIALADEGCDVAVVDVREQAAKQTAAEVESRGRGALVIAANVSQRGEVEDMVARSIAGLGALDVLVNNAGIVVQGPVAEIPVEDWEAIVGVNLWAHIWAVRAALPHMLERGSGHIVHTASAAGLVPTGWAVPYGTTKFAVVGLAENLYCALSSSGIGVSVICPMFVATDLMSTARSTVPGDERADEEIRTAGNQFIQAAGIPPEQVGSDTVAAIKDGRFWVLPHPQVADQLRVLGEDPEEFMRRSAAIGGMLGPTLGGPTGR